ncbi:MAG: 2,5-diamino-6-(ribosylamino)-4(3H)-pyrimidinone 5'-phosphate reductase [Candidatus Hodarchaeota archaeon]
MKNVKKPYVILNAAMTIDGKISSKEGDSEISDEEDWKEVHKLRTQVDAIMVGKNTILKDNPKLHIKFYEHNGYYRIVVDSNLSIPIDSQVITFKPETYPTIICTTENVHQEKVKEFEAKNIKVIKNGKSSYVDLKKLMSNLYNLGIKSVLLEGGGNLNWSFIKEDLVDEIRLTIAPWIVGGKNSITLAEGKGFDKMHQARSFKLVDLNHRENYVILKYKRC